MGMMEVFKKLLGQSNEAEVRRLQKIADQVLAKEAEYRALTDEQLQAKTPEFKQRLQSRAKRWTIFCPTPLPPAAKPPTAALGMRPFRVQVIGGIMPASGPHRGDEDRRGQNPGGHPARLPKRPDRRGRPHRHRQRLPGHAATASGWARSTASWA